MHVVCSSLAPVLRFVLRGDRHGRHAVSRTAQPALQVLPPRGPASTGEGRAATAVALVSAFANATNYEPAQH